MKSWNEFRTVKAKKKHQCAHCLGRIVPSEVHIQFVWRWSGDFQDWRVHADCFDPMQTCQGNMYDGELCDNPHRRGLACDEVGAENPSFVPAPETKLPKEDR